MEKQWDADSRSSEFSFLQKAWQKNLINLWPQICSHVQHHPTLSCILDNSTSPATSDPLSVNDDFPSHPPMDDVFMNYSSKPAPQMGTVDETPMELEGFLATSNPIQRAKETEEMEYLASEELKKKTKQKVVYPIPEDFRHYKYLPVGVSLPGLILDHSHRIAFEWTESISSPNEHAQTVKSNRRTRTKPTFFFLRFLFVCWFMNRLRMEGYFLFPIYKWSYRLYPS